MLTIDLKDIVVAKLVDARGTACPGPLLEAKRAVSEVPGNGIMEVLSSDEGTMSDMSRWSKKVGHTYLGDVEDDGYWHVYVKIKA